MNSTKSLENVIKNEDGKLVFEISRKKHIEKFEIQEVLSYLEMLLISPKLLFNKLIISIDGYDKDTRELKDIQEVRDYLTFLDKCFPYWFYFSKLDVPPNLRTPALIMMCTCKSTVEKGYLEFDEEDYIYFFENHFIFMNEIMEKEKYTEDQIQDRTMRIFESFRAK